MSSLGVDTSRTFPLISRVDPTTTLFLILTISLGLSGDESLLLHRVVADRYVRSKGGMSVTTLSR